ncbi:general APC amino acid permease [Punctularia strigosozonata HHB-11173 SS5]|uniref:general APC amino acid permease n=1 Tax=Punctularia strigosozonata (strain HHB-11173) TaxID=741275 RepID=UPI0004416F96|nr:general APC amino acid permease [Punctularia strigosozonata HHB-11173 SS5]EIN06222.1 general APC amino acid permease [Punctularia strigosozonata HHB-11173 SS5]
MASTVADDKVVDASSLEKGPVDTSSEKSDRYAFDAADLDRVQRRLSQRHIQMIAIAGTIGADSSPKSGSGHALAGAGPLGALLAYALVGTTAYSTLCSLGEMTSHAPVSGTFPHYAARWVDPALGFTVGWNYYWSNAIATPAEISAATILLTFWDDSVRANRERSISHQYVYTAVLVAAIIAMNFIGVRWYGESEFMFSILKLLLITGLIILGLVIDLGGAPDHDRRGFRFWDDPGPFARAGLVSNPNTDKFLGFLSVIVQAAFSFQGMELVAVAAAETESPRRNIATAVRRVFYRVVIFYILGVLITGMIVPSNDPTLLHSTGTAAESPYVIAMRLASIKVLPSIVNAVIFTSAFSAGSSYLYCSARILYGLGLRRQAPKIVTYCAPNGVPVVSVAITSAFAFLAFMNASSGAATVFSWLVNLTTVGGFFSWGVMCLTYIYFHRGMKVQGIDRTQLVYHNRLQPYIAWWGLIWNVIFILINGFEVFWSFNASDFLTAYINIPIFFGLYFFWKIWKKTKFWKPEEMDFVTGIPSIEETETPLEPAHTLAQKIASKIF